MKKTAIMAVAVAAGATLPLFAATIVDTFESSSAWEGGETKAETYTPSAILPTTADHTKVLAFEGTATRTIDVGDSGNIIDMMCKIAALEDAPATYSTEVAGALFAIAVAPDRKLQIYCKTSSTADAAFTAIDDTVYDADAWVRITVAIDYTATPKSFQLAVNGTIKPATYYLANANASTITTVKAIGTSSIDDFVVKNDTTNNALDAYAQVDANGNPVTTTVDGVAVPNEYVSKKVPSGAKVTDKISGSSLTYLEAYLAGVEPSENAKFSVTSAQVTGNAVTLSFPGSWPANTYTIKYGSDPTSLEPVATASTTATKESGVNKVTVPLSFSGTGTGTLYFKVSR